MREKLKRAFDDAYYQAKVMAEEDGTSLIRLEYVYKSEAEFIFRAVFTAEDYSEYSATIRIKDSESE